MMKKVMTVLVFLVFAGASLMMVSCAKKQVMMGQPAVMAPKPAPVAPAPAPAPAPSVSEEAPNLGAEVQAFEAMSIYFDFDKSEIKPEAKAILDKKAAWLREHSEYRVQIQGNCDERGTTEYNLALGERRAKAAMKFLNALGIAADRISTLSYGKERPVCKEHNEACWSKNRRDDFRLSK
jgi:peptidoglycan-associated lipoprotein